MGKKQGRPEGKKYTEKITLLLTHKMRKAINNIGTKKDFITEMDALRYTLKKGIKVINKKERI